MKKTSLSFALAAVMGLGATSAQAITLNWVTNDESDNLPFPATDPANTAAFGTLAGAADPDFRVMNGGAVSGGGEKAISNGVSWTFDGADHLSSVAGTDATPGAPYYCTNAGDCSVAPGGDTGLFKNALFLGNPFGFLAPTVGSAAGSAYGEATIHYDATDNFSIYIPVLEAQWNAAAFTIGLHNGGTTLNCTGAMTGNLFCQGEVQIDQLDDSLGFAAQWLQFELVGNADPFATTEPPSPTVPVPAAVWLFGSGLLGLVGAARRKKAG